MEHIIKRHIRPVKSGKSYFLSQDAKYVSCLVTRTISNPDQILPHRGGNSKEVIKKVFPLQIGVHGYNGKACYSITAVIDTMNNQVITAYPTLKW